MNGVKIKTLSNDHVFVKFTDKLILKIGFEKIKIIY
jgi:hypothetical protein